MNSLLEIAQKSQKSIKASTASLGFSLAEAFAARTSTRTQHFVASALAWAISPFAPYENQAAGIIARQTGDNPHKIAREATQNFIIEVLEVSQLVRRALGGEEIIWPPFIEPSIDQQIRDFFDSKASIIATIHSANPFSGAELSSRLLGLNTGTPKKFGAFTEKLPPRVAEGYRKIAQGLNLNLIDTTANDRAIAVQIIRNNHKLVHAERNNRGGVYPVEFFGQNANFAAWIGDLSIRTGQPILPVGIIVIENGQRAYTAVFGNVLKPQDYIDSQSLTQELANELEKIVSQSPGSFYFFSPFWKARR